MTTRAVGQPLLHLARLALEARVRGHSPPEVPAHFEVDAFGVFVTIHHRGELRGCLGSLDCADDVVTSLVRLAGAVAHDDYRFDPLQESELPHTTLDISLLTPPRPVTDLRSIEVGRHGLIVQRGRHRGLLLPQVAPEHGWDREAFLSHTCVKAGLAPDAWKSNVQIFSFEAEVFREEPPECEA